MLKGEALKQEPGALPLVPYKKPPLSQKGAEVFAYHQRMLSSSQDSSWMVSASLPPVISTLITLAR